MTPNFLIIGPPKCASTSLHFYLSQHPDIYMSEVKETNFFTQDYNRGIEFYENYFRNAKSEKIIGEATPSYSFLPFAADRIKATYPDIKLLLCFRNPIDRAFSNWLMLWDAGVEKASFNEAIDINYKQFNRINFEGEEGGCIWNDRVNNIEKGEKWIRIYLQAGMYATILKMYKERFSQNQIKYIFIDDLKKDFDGTMKDIFKFLKINEDFKIPKTVEKNFYFNRKIYRNLNSMIGIKQTRFISKRLPPFIKNMFKQKKQLIQNVPVLTKEDRHFLWDFYKSEINELEKITSKNLSNWNPDMVLSTY